MDLTSVTRMLLALTAAILLSPHPASALQCIEARSVVVCSDPEIHFECDGGPVIRACYKEKFDCVEFSCPQGGVPPAPFCEHHCNAGWNPPS
jgi:hypothetical protein